MALLVGLPWFTWFPTWGYRTGGEAAREIPLFLYTAFALIAIGLWLVRWDLWLGLFVAYTAARAVAYHTALALAIAHWVAIGALVITVVRSWPAPWLAVLRWALVVGGVLECVYLVIQAFGRDPMWQISGWKLDGQVSTHGTLDHPTLTAAMLAMLVPLAPWWLILPFIIGLVLTHSLTATVAAVIGLAVRWRTSMPRWVVALGSAGAAVMVAGLFWTKSHDSYHERIFAWATALREMDHNWAALLLGFGPGSWYRIVPVAQIAAQPSRTEVFYQGHNEFMQFFFEGGLIAVAMLVAWTWEHREQLAPAGGVVACAVLCIATFPFHVAPAAATAIAVIALALAGVSGREMKVAPVAATSWKYWV